MSINFPRTIEDAVTAAVDDNAEVRAGGTDLQERLASRPHDAVLVDLTRVEGLSSIERRQDGSVDIGALVTVGRIAAELGESHDALAATARGLATPQIRAVATIGGNLAQHTRCWYARHPDLGCFKTGGDYCPARGGDHRLGVIFDSSACVHPHPSSMALALYAYHAVFSTTGGIEGAPIAELYGTGDDPSRHHLLDAGEIITHINVPRVPDGERGAYVRAISRFEAEWPLVEAVARVTVADGVIVEAHLAVGGVAPTPLRLDRVAESLLHQPPTIEAIESASLLAVEGATPLPATGYKADLLIGCVAEVLMRAVGR